MPTQKDLKRLTRSRMKKTGEAYTTARARLLEKKENQNQPAVKPAAYAELAGMSDAAVKAKTGCDWERWVWWLDQRNAAEMPHREIARLIDSKFDFGGWWAQTVTVGYERIKGLREIGQRRGGGYEINKSKTVAAPIGELYRAFSVARTRRRWLPDADLEVRKATAERSMRICWGDGSAVDVYFYARGEAKSQVTVQHRKLSTKADADRLRKFWGERLAELARLVGPAARGSS